METERPENPFIDLVSSLGEGTSNKIKCILLPPREGIMFLIGPLVYRVTYINSGKLSFSAEFYGVRTKDGIMRPGGKLERSKSKNVTLDVQNGSIDGNAIFEKRDPVKQNTVE